MRQAQSQDLAPRVERVVHSLHVRLWRIDLEVQVPSVLSGIANRFPD